VNLLLTNYSMEELIQKTNENTSEHFLYKDGRPLYSILDNKLLDGEEFKDHPSCPVKVSNLGRIMQKGNVLKQFPDETKKYPYGYLQVRFINTTKREKTFYVYKLVAETWCTNPDRSLYTDIHHINNNGTNNTVQNLIWLTCEQHAEIHPFMKKSKRYKDFIKKNKE
jgi:hypothetical protein